MIAIERNLDFREQGIWEHIPKWNFQADQMCQQVATKGQNRLVRPLFYTTLNMNIQSSVTDIIIKFCLRILPITNWF